MTVIRTFFDWLSLHDYDKAKHAAERELVARFARGNVLLQLGHYITAEDASEITRRGDRAMDRLNRAARRGPKPPLRCEAGPVHVPAEEWMDFVRA